MTVNLKGKRCLITGGSRGIGAAIVKKFAGEGCNIVINYLNSADAAKQLANDMHAQHGIRAVAIQGDMAKESDCKALVQEAEEALGGGLDVIVSNAGNTKAAPFDDIYALSSEDWRHAWNVLVMANVWLMQEAAPLFNANADGGTLLMMSSLAALVTNGSSMAYSVARAAENHVTRCLAQTQGPKIRVNAVCPGFVATERTEGVALEVRDRYEDMATLKRVTTVEDVADAFVFLAKNPGITGEKLRVDSGMAIC